MTATAREFLLIVRIRGLKDKEIFSYLNRIEKTLNENGFSARRYSGEDIKTLLAVFDAEELTGALVVLLLLFVFQNYLLSSVSSYSESSV